MIRIATSAIALFLLIELCTPAVAFAQIYVAPSALAPPDMKRVRVSVKVINGSNGVRPTFGYYHTNDQIQSAIDDSNLALEAMGADWRLQLVEILDVRGLVEWMGEVNCDRKSAFETDARNDPSRYLYRHNALNIYVFEALSGCGGYCSMPSSGEEIIIINNRDGILNWGLGWLHEIGHYFGLQHTFQCFDRPCTSDPNVCTGAGSELRLCPDACPDTTNLMGAAENLTPFNVSLSRCQLGEISRTMDPSGGWRSKVILFPVEADPVASTTGNCSTEPVGIDSPIGSQNAGAAIGVTVVGGGSVVSETGATPRDENGNVIETNIVSGTTPRDGNGCLDGIDTVNPIVERIDADFDQRTLRMIGLTVQFSEPIDVVEVQNGTDFLVRNGEKIVYGLINWRENNAELVWKATADMNAGSYSIWMAGKDGSDFRDIAGNELVTNSDGFFTVNFEVDSLGQLLLPASPACGTGVLFPGFVGLLMSGNFIRRRRKFAR